MKTLRNWTSAAACIVACAMSAHAGDSYAVRVQSASAPGQPQQTIRIERPQPGTFVPGVVVVKTRSSYAVGKGDRIMASASITATMASLLPSEVRYAMYDVVPRKLDPTAASHGLDRIFQLKYDEPMDPFDVCVRLMADPDVEYAVPLYVHKLAYRPNDPRFSSQAGARAMNVEAAWDIAKGTKDVLVAIIDSGTDIDHEDLAPQIWTNTKEVPNNNVDDDGNGYIDDVRGWDFVGNVSSADVQQGVLRPDNDAKVRNPSMNDRLAHGTTTAGCAAARADNNIGIAGVGFDVSILPIKCGSDNPSFGGILGGYAAIRYAADMGADVINCSWGGTGADPSAFDVVNYAISKGAVVVAATGNDGNDMAVVPQYPALVPGLLSVGSISDNRRISGFSNYGIGTTTFAPGESVLTTYPGNGYNGQTGTSFSTPLVAGLAALLKSMHPDWTPEQIILQIRGTSKAIAGVSASDRPRYWGWADAADAVRLNRSFTSGDRMPGIVIDRIQTSGGATALNSTAATTVDFVIRNILAPCSGGALQITSLDPRVRIVGNASPSFGAIGTNATANVPLQIDVDEDFPWYEASIRFAVSIVSERFNHWQLVSIPFSRPSQNRHTDLGNPATIEWTHVSIPSSNEVWAAAATQQGSVMHRAGSFIFLPLPFAPNAFLMRSNGLVWLGGTSGQQGTIAYSTNSGQSFQSVNVQATLSTVSDIVMFTNTVGLAFGSNVGNRFGVMRTTDGMQWTSVAATPIKSGNNESPIPGTAVDIGDTVFVATSAGRIVRSLNRGQTWTAVGIGASGATIVDVAFRSASEGMVLYQTSAASSRFRVSMTTNGGTSFTAVATDLPFTARPVALTAGPNAFAITCSDGSTYGSDDGGKTWAPIYSRESGSVRTALAPSRNTALIYMAGGTLASLQYRFASINGPRLMSFSTQQLNFGTMESNQTRSRIVSVRNTGTGLAAIESVVIVPGAGTPDTTFRITGMPPTTVAGGENAQISLVFNTAVPGAHSATLRVVSNGTPATIELPLSGSVNAPSSVDTESSAHIQLAPVPSGTVATLSLPVAEVVDIAIVDALGSIVKTMTTDATTVQLDVASLPQGTYTVMVRGNTLYRTLPLVIVR